MLFPKPLKRPRLRRQPREWRLHGVPVAFEQFRAYIVRRDGTCLAFRLDATHVCKGRDGRIHSPDNIEKLTLDHVPTRGENALGRKAHYVDPDTGQHYVDEHLITALCALLNGGGGAPSSELRDYQRWWIEEREAELSSGRVGGH